MIPPVAFILGNGPTLPVGKLCELSRCFTVGVNRIMHSGFVPTVLMAADPDVLSDINDDIAASGVLAVTCRLGPWKTKTLRAVGGHDAWDQEPTPKAMNICGSTGVGAAKWARSLGCKIVYLLGMSGTYGEDGRTDFYGDNPAHSQVTAGVLRGERDRLLASSGAYIDADGLDLALLADGQDVDQQALRAHICEVIA